MFKKIFLILISISTLGCITDITLSSKKDLDFLYNEIFKLRASLGLPKLEIAPELEITAKAYSKELAYYNVLTHTLLGTTPNDRLNQYDTSYYQFEGEILASGFKKETVVQGWLDSPGHRKILINNHSKVIGIGIAKSKTNTLYFVALFGGIK